MHNLIVHFTQKPMELTDKIVKSCSPKDIFNVLIPFCGSGSESVVTLQNKGTRTAFEINKDYILLAEENIKWYQSQKK